MASANQTEAVNLGGAQPGAMPAANVLSLRDITKTYPGVIANNAISLNVGHNEIHALLGENGAGKSTLVKILYGLVKPNAGSISINGTAQIIASPQQARALGIAMVFQHFSLFEAMTVSENVAVGVEKAVPGQALNRKITEISNAYGLALDPDAMLSSLSVGEKQRVEIVRALLQDPKILILDEPTSVLTHQEADALFDVLRRLRDNGTSVIYISHKLDEIRRLCDQATILRGGEVVASCDPTKESPASLAQMMIGERIAETQFEKRDVGAARLSISGLKEHGLTVESLDVRAGEIVGIAGVAGNGQDALVDLLAGELRTKDAQSIVLNSEGIGNLSPVERRQMKLASLPEERLGHAAVPSVGLASNLFLTGHHQRDLSNNGLIQFSKLAKNTEAVIARFDVRNASPSINASGLSGGNLQKFVMGREIAKDPDVLIVAQPTWGVDTGAAKTIHNALDALARAGSAILVISQDLDELLSLTDRLAVICEGTLSDAKPTNSWNEADIGLAMAGELSRTGQGGTQDGDKIR